MGAIDGVTVLISAYVEEHALAPPSIKAIETVKQAYIQKFIMQDIGEIDISHLLTRRRNIENAAAPLYYRDDRRTTCFQTSLIYKDTFRQNFTRRDRMRYLRSIVGKPTWLANYTRPDIGFGTEILQGYLHALSQDHLDAAYGVLLYLADASNLDMVYFPDGSVTTVKGYIDANWTCDIQRKRRSLRVSQCT